MSQQRDRSASRGRTSSRRDSASPHDSNRAVIASNNNIRTPSTSRARAVSVDSAARPRGLPDRDRWSWGGHRPPHMNNRDSDRWHEEQWRTGRNIDRGSFGAGAPRLDGGQEQRRASSSPRVDASQGQRRPGSRAGSRVGSRVGSRIRATKTQTEAPRDDSPNRASFDIRTPRGSTSRTRDTGGQMRQPGEGKERGRTVVWWPRNRPYLEIRRSYPRRASSLSPDNRPRSQRQWRGVEIEFDCGRRPETSWKSTSKWFRRLSSPVKLMEGQEE